MRTKIYRYLDSDVLRKADSARFNPDREPVDETNQDEYRFGCDPGLELDEAIEIVAKRCADRWLESQGPQKRGRSHWEIRGSIETAIKYYLQITCFNKSPSEIARENHYTSRGIRKMVERARLILAQFSDEFVWLMEKLKPVYGDDE